MSVDGEQALDDGQAEGQVGHEVRVHDVDVQPVAIPSTAAASSARRAKSADRMLGAMRGAGTAVIVAQSTPMCVSADDAGSRSTWRRCRGGAARAGRPGRRGRVAAGIVGQERGRVEQLRAGLRHHGAHHLDGLGGVRGAGRVGDDAARAHPLERVGEQAALQLGELGDVLGPPPPPRLGSAAQRPETRCRARRRAPGRTRPRAAPPRGRRRRARAPGAPRWPSRRGPRGAAPGRRRPASRPRSRRAPRASRPSRRGRRRGRARTRRGPVRRDRAARRGRRRARRAGCPRPGPRPAPRGPAPGRRGHRPR